METDPDNRASTLTEGTVRFLKILVSVLTLTMIGGVIAIFTVIVIRFPQSNTATAPILPNLPDSVQLPEGLTPEAVTFAGDWIAVISASRILIFDRTTGALRQSVEVQKAP